MPAASRGLDVGLLHFDRWGNPAGTPVAAPWAIAPPRVFLDSLRRLDLRRSGRRPRLLVAVHAIELCRLPVRFAQRSLWHIGVVPIAPAPSAAPSAPAPTAGSIIALFVSSGRATCRLVIAGNLSSLRARILCVELSSIAAAIH